MNTSSKRLRIRKLTEEDVTGTYVGWLNDKEVMRFSNQRFITHTMESSLSYVEGFRDSHNCLLGIFVQEGGAMIGTATIYRSMVHGTADVGLLIGESTQWGKGYGQEAWEAITAKLISEPGIRKVTAGTASPNTGMIRILEKSGMRREAIRERQEIIDGSEVDILYYARFTS